MTPFQKARGCLLAVWLLVSFCSRGRGADDIFGRSEKGGDAALIGIFYDLKQTQQRKPTGVLPPDYSRVVEDFLSKGWDEAVLGPYFRAVRSLYTTQIFIPMMSAGEAPKAYEVQEIVKPSEWLAHYKGQVSPPEDGTYRFVGYADDVLAVAVNEKTVLVGARFDVPAWKATVAPRIAAGNGRLSYGDWIELKKDQIIDLDVLIGERPGSVFGAFLLYEKQGANYALNDQGEPILPIFQLARHEMPVYPRHLAPVFTVPATPWRGWQ